MKKIIYVCTFLLSAAVLINCWCTQVLQKLENNIVRLHIVANSDSVNDQNIKLKVRDRIIELAEEVGSVPTVEQMEAEANELLLKEDAPYRAKAAFGKYHIDRRKYESFILPEGIYTAARIELGSGRGKNWWCVLSPPLCFTKSAFGDTNELEAFIGEEAHRAVNHKDITVKLKLLEIVSSISRSIMQKYQI